MRRRCTHIIFGERKIVDNIERKKSDGKPGEETSVLELMEFSMAGNAFGINVAKVIEIMRRCPITPMIKSHPCIEGVFKPRGKIITVINLPRYMQMEEEIDGDKDMFMLTNFDNVNAAFHVHSVEGMHQIKWSDVEKPSSIIYGGNDSVITGTTKIGEKIITIIDFEKVLFDINPETGLQLSEVKVMGERDRNEKPIVVVEDSVFLKKMILQALEMAGFTEITAFDNGEDAWEYLQKVRADCKSIHMPVESQVSIIITDIEMPRMDGHHLTQLVKNDDFLKKIPILVFSSLIDEAQKLLGEKFGVDAHLSKPQIGKLVSTIDEWIL